MNIACLFFIITNFVQAFRIYNNNNNVNNNNISHKTNTNTNNNTTNNNTTEGILISGGDSYGSVEVFNPTTGQSCELPSLPYQRFRHTMDGMTICGGVSDDNGNTCLTFSSGQWVNSHTLTQDRSDHCSWSTSDGIVLLGGDMWDSQTTTETVRQGELDSQPGFTLQYRTVHACSIHDITTDTLIITGGNETKKYVTRYDVLGFVEDLPPLNEGRYAHGCGAYLREDGTQALLVAGGVGHQGYLSSTEILATPTSDWLLTTKLPRKMEGLKGATVAGFLYMTGGRYPDDPNTNGYRDEVYKWKGEDWVEVGKLKTTRYAHAVSIVMLDEEVMPFCK